MAGLTPPPTLLMDRATIEACLSIRECIACVESAFSAHAEGLAYKPRMLHVEAGDGDFHIKSGGFRRQPAYIATKINGSYFGNRRKTGLPNIIGLILLSDATTGTPLAVMESGYITRLRTGAASAVAAKCMARPDSKTITICGAGLQGEIQLRAIKEVLPIERVFIWSRGGAAELAQRAHSSMDVDAQAVSDLSSAVSKSDVVITCTPSTSWFLAKADVRAGTFIAAVGSDGPGKQELEPALLASSKVIPDLLEQATRVGELQHLDATQRNEVIQGELGAAISGLIKGRDRYDDITIFDSTGTALQDCAAAGMAYERARAMGIGVPFPFWN